MKRRKHYRSWEGIPVLGSAYEHNEECVHVCERDRQTDRFYRGTPKDKCPRFDQTLTPHF